MNREEHKVVEQGDSNNQLHDFILHNGILHNGINNHVSLSYRAPHTQLTWKYNCYSKHQANVSVTLAAGQAASLI